jgi:DNA-binding NarL/FixJ family response regulator
MAGTELMAGTNTGSPPIRVLVADDQPIFTKMLEAVLASDERVEVVGRATNGKQALELAAELAPDVILMDISMPIMDGLEATRRLRERDPSVRVLMLTESDFPGDVMRARKAGASGYVPKTRIASTLSGAIVKVIED